jgi:hypothetical protein
VRFRRFTEEPVFSSYLAEKQQTEPPTKAEPEDNE